jgi:phosphoglycerate dehydrogenase-like enzyme
MAEFVAESVLAMGLSAMRDIPDVTATMRKGGWPNERGRFWSLKEADVGFVGLGSVGRNLIQLLDPFNVSVTIYDPYVDTSSAVFDRNWVSVTDDLTMAVEADLVSIHASLTPETTGLVDEDVLSAMPESSVIVNCARVPITAKDALSRELKTGKIRAAIDTFDNEPLQDDAEIRTQATVLTPHVAGAPSRELLAPTIIDEIERYLNGEPLEGQISKETFKRMTQDSLTEL